MTQGLSHAVSIENMISGVRQSAFAEAPFFDQFLNSGELSP
jgi:hypothetical protein